jgi:hypothetical protein
MLPVTDFILPDKKAYAFRVFIAVLFILNIACESKKVKESKDADLIQKDPVITIVTNNMDFQCPDTIPSGWNTFLYDNRSNETHFFLFDQYPEGKTILDTEKEILPVFQKGMNLITEGNSEDGFAAFNMLPEWFFNVVFVGGSGLVSPRSSTLTTIKLDPGYYVLECYVKMPDGTFHGTMGMAKEIIVSVENSGLQPPLAQVKIDISSTEGIVFTDSISSGKQVFSVHFKDQITHENFVGHDVNLVKYDESANLEVLESWLNWADPRGLISPAPDGFVFLGGVNDMPTGSTGYFEAELDPGNYAFVSEVPGSIKKNLFKTFVIANE